MKTKLSITFAIILLVLKLSAQQDKSCALSNNFLGVDNLTIDGGVDPPDTVWLNEDYINAMQKMEDSIVSWLDTNSDSIEEYEVITIPVVVHVVYNSDSENISYGQVMTQITALNRDYRRSNPDTINTPSWFNNRAKDTRIQFCLANRDPLGNPTNGITRTYTENTEFIWSSKEVHYSNQGGKDGWPTDRYLNLWVCDLRD